ncbi:aryl-alcohol dehydrogenase-like predicted oxidoreductase [Glaciihabitans tibetensis]|uniref:Aryl-alcohol dehydrogenase-like predicted oxidoreductase n=1 Tax=Glaciihabitans tibetensis TaxID=1266600 RepID=A0A2T0VE38_9MICO|nr:aldo/keto reductase [Glaciihabitans tibetensis]PRY68444.1 aryl-alcohol dehydrogenase-like predicted oxidoreductase [Glaciihabitans tibetensis]
MSEKTGSQPTTYLGRTGVEVSRLCLGTMMFGDWGNKDHDDSIRVIHRAIDAGINFIDTADIYSFGESEEIVGKAIAQSGKREDIVLATKFFNGMKQQPNYRGGSRRWIIRSVEDFLRRLQTDYIDLYQMHRPDEYTDIEESLGALSDLVTQGKVRYIGSSTFQPSQVVEAQWAARQNHTARFVTEQPPYSMLTRGIEADLLPTTHRHGMGTLVWSPLAGGWLSGKFREGQPLPTTHRSDRDPGRYNLEHPQIRAKFEAADKLGALADELEVPLVHLALAFVLRHPGVTSAIIGPRTMEQLESQLHAASLELDDDTLDRIDAIVPPGTNINPDDAGFSNYWLEAPRRRR